LFVTEDGSGTIWRVSYRKAGTTAETAPSKELATEGRLPRKGKFRVAQQATAHDDQPPLPERNPVHAGASALKTPPPPGEVPTIPWSDAEVAAAKAKCTEALSSIKLNYEPLAPIKQGLCGAPAPILLKTLGGDPRVELDPPVVMTCQLARALNTWLDKTVQPKAEALFGSPVAKLHNASSYACRNRYHSGERVTVLDNWPKNPFTPPLPLPNPVHVATVGTSVPMASTTSADQKAKFVKYLHDDACPTFGTVLGPDANEAHKSHFHFDMKQRRASLCQ
jgi:hypothetical protein